MLPGELSSHSVQLPLHKGGWISPVSIAHAAAIPSPSAWPTPSHQVRCDGGCVTHQHASILRCCHATPGKVFFLLPNLQQCERSIGRRWGQPPHQRAATCLAVQWGQRSHLQPESSQRYGESSIPFPSQPSLTPSHSIPSHLIPGCREELEMGELMIPQCHP